MKLAGILGSGTGRLGNAVFAVSGGSQLVRQYQPVVSNPKTTMQVNQRARFKLMSQIAAALAPVIAISRNGLVSARNQFVKVNKRWFYGNDQIASVSYENLQLTNSTIALPRIIVNRPDSDEEANMTISLESDATENVDAVVYAIFTLSNEGTFKYVRSLIVRNAGNAGTFQTVTPKVAGQVIFYAYGIKFNAAAASNVYNDYAIQSGTDIARLVATTSNLSTSTFTQTRGTTLLSDSEETSNYNPQTQARVFVTASGNGTVSGAGTFDLNSSVTVTATPTSPSIFVGWQIQGRSGYVSTQATYTFTLIQQTDLIAVFQEPDEDEGYDF